MRMEVNGSEELARSSTSEPLVNSSTNWLRTSRRRVGGGEHQFVLRRAKPRISKMSLASTGFVGADLHLQIGTADLLHIERLGRAVQPAGFEQSLRVAGF